MAILVKVLFKLILIDLDIATICKMMKTLYDGAWLIYHKQADVDMKQMKKEDIPVVQVSRQGKDGIVFSSCFVFPL